MSSDSKLEKSQKREIAYINMHIVERTEKVFPDETKLIRASTNLMRRITSVSKDAISEFSAEPNLPAVMNLFARNRELVHFSMVCLMNAGYASTKILSRAALENTLCMRLFNKKPDLAKKWSTNPDEFGQQWTPQKIRDELFLRDSDLWHSYNEFYWKLCNYTHPSFKGWTELIHERAIPWRPLFNADYASECIGLVFFIFVQSLQQFANSFERWFTPKLLRKLIS
jgi:hypothetical protein